LFVVRRKVNFGIGEFGAVRGKLEIDIDCAITEPACEFQGERGFA